MRSIPALLLAVGLLSGCVSSPHDAAPATAQPPGDSSTPEPTSPTPPTGDNHTVVNNTEQPVNWTALHYTVEGTANSWLIAFQPLPAPVDKVHYSMATNLFIRFPADTPGGALLAIPAPASGANGAIKLDTSYLYQIYDADGGDFQALFNHNPNAGQGGPGAGKNDTGPVAGFFFALITSGDYKLDVMIQLGMAPGMDKEPDLFAPSFVARGGNVTFVAPGSSNGGTVPVVSTTVTITQPLETPGWSHLQLAGVAPYLESHDIQFPDNTGHQQDLGFPTLYGIGTLQDAKGDFSATVESVHGDKAPRDLVFLHAPAGPGDFPPKFQFFPYQLLPFAQPPH